MASLGLAIFVFFFLSFIFIIGGGCDCLLVGARKCCGLFCIRPMLKWTLD